MIRIFRFTLISIISEVVIKSTQHQQTPFSCRRCEHSFRAKYNYSFHFPIAIYCERLIFSRSFEGKGDTKSNRTSFLVIVVRFIGSCNFLNHCGGKSEFIFHFFTLLYFHFFDCPSQSELLFFFSLTFPVLFHSYFYLKCH